MLSQTYRIDQVWKTKIKVHHKLKLSVAMVYNQALFTMKICDGIAHRKMHCRIVLAMD
jgi:hypothetical protein